MMDTLQSPPKRGRPRKYRDELETNREMTKRRAERFKKMGWVRPSWHLNQKTVMAVRLSKRHNETLDEAVTRLIKVVFDQPYDDPTPAVVGTSQPPLTVSDGETNDAHTGSPLERPKPSGQSLSPISPRQSAQMEFDF